MDTIISRVKFSEDGVTSGEVDAVLVAQKRPFEDASVGFAAAKRAEGKDFQAQCDSLSGTIQTGNAWMTTAHAILADFIVVMNLPLWKGGGWSEDEKLAACLAASFVQVRDNDCKSIGISTSCVEKCAFPNNRDVRVAVGQAIRFLAQFEDMQVTFLGVGAKSEYKDEVARQLVQRIDTELLQRLDMGLGNIEVCLGDITKLENDAIVNAANTALKGGGGVDGAIHRAAGPRLMKECIAIGGCPTGHAVVTRGYRLAAKYVIQTAGPVWSGGYSEESELLGSCYMSSLERAAERGCGSIAFPAISCGIYRFPPERAVKIAVGCVINFLRLTRRELKVTFCCFDRRMFSLYEKEVQLQGATSLIS